MREGQQVFADDVYRGEVLVRPHEEWALSYRSYVRARLSLDVITLVVVGTTVSIAAYWIAPPFGVVVQVCMLVVGVAEALSYIATKRALDSEVAPPALYEGGVEMPMYPMYAIRLFIPWSQMADAWVRRSRLLDDMLYISVVGSRWRWRVPGRLLGEDGMQVAVQRARSPEPPTVPPPAQQAPRLVLYSAEGAKTESTPEET